MFLPEGRRVDHAEEECSECVERQTEDFVSRPVFQRPFRSGIESGPYTGTGFRERIRDPEPFTPVL